MIAMTLQEIADAVGGTILSPTLDSNTVFSGSAETDSRLVTQGSIFFAMPGEETDGHRFIDAAIANGAALLICEEHVSTSTPAIRVDSGAEALAQLAKTVVARVRAAGELAVVGITGSNGKTTTKSMLQAILEHHGETVSPVKSFNNHIGAPMTMLRVTEQTKYLVLELGASGKGEIAKLVALVKPDVGVVLKVGLAHAGEFGGVEATQAAKRELVTPLTAEDVAILNRDDARVFAMKDDTAAAVRTFGLDAQSTLWASEIESSIDGTSFELHGQWASKPLESRVVRLQILGDHHVMNALAALSAADALGIDLDSAIASLEALPLAERGRMELMHASRWTVINDAYNASPDSMAAALKSLAHIARGAGRRSVAVLGEMSELGEYSFEEHDRIGLLAVRLNIDKLVVVGVAARQIHNAAEREGSYDAESVFVEDAEAARRFLDTALRDNDLILVKSSNSAGLQSLGDEIGAL
ncbi:UDP-N-acetylmuramoyl-tripeptide--D-alanyl-D-alanine ligase [Humidisolicoccus flavus]|uniref:UDP-N-acetylmuramoyl-tripeptide--D-alanyl-D- alanine ligase n=1 Tax=Humidisolicoccus flavus TaxID=3111414 RepID=UPI00325304A7